MQAKVYSVQTINYHINKSNPPQLVVHALGQVNSTGWTSGTLIPWVYIDQPSDGIMDFDFVATRPSGVVLWMLSPIDGSNTITMEQWIKGVRIHSVSGSEEILFDQVVAMKSNIDGGSDDGDPAPFPWLVPTEVSDPA